MKKIPLKSEPSVSSPEPLATGFLLAAMDVLLLGAVWLFVLVWQPFFQQQIQQQKISLALSSFYELQWMVVLCLALVILLLLWLGRAERVISWMQIALLTMMVLVSVVMLMDLPLLAGSMSQPAAVVQALSGLVYFVIARIQSADQK